MNIDSFWEEPEPMTYHRVVMVKYPVGPNLMNIRGLKFITIQEADLILVKNRRNLRKSGLIAGGYRADKDRYGRTGRFVPASELTTILKEAKQVTEVTSEINISL